MNNLPYDQLTQIFETLTDSINNYEESVLIPLDDDSQTYSEDYNNMYAELVSGFTFVYGNTDRKKPPFYTMESVREEQALIDRIRGAMNSIMPFYDFIVVLQLVADYYSQPGVNGPSLETISKINQTVTLGPVMQCLAACRASIRATHSLYPTQIRRNYHPYMHSDGVFEIIVKVEPEARRLPQVSFRFDNADFDFGKMTYNSKHRAAEFRGFIQENFAPLGSFAERPITIAIPPAITEAVPQLAGTLLLNDENWHLFEMCVYMSNGPTICAFDLPGAIVGNEDNICIDTGNKPVSTRTKRLASFERGPAQVSKLGASFTELCI